MGFGGSPLFKNLQPSLNLREDFSIGEVGCMANQLTGLNQLSCHTHGVLSACAPASLGASLKPIRHRSQFSKS
jgi:hypothetical protein